jgi:ATP-binding cassette subfamily F protein uup
VTVGSSSRPLLLSCEGVTHQFGARPLFKDLSFGLYQGDRVGLVGPNGSGKSTLMRVLAGKIDPDQGQVSLRKGVRVGYVEQEARFPGELSAEEVVIRALAGEPLEEYEKEARAARTLGRLGFRDRGEREQRVAALSGGWKKRLAIACEVAREPDLILLDEPTNHLDLEGILELETLLGEIAQAFMVVSHDRYFLENVARRMIELDRVYPEGLLVVDGAYSDLLERRDEVRRNQQEYQESLANRARREVEWLRRGPKARTTKSKARIDRAHDLLGELAAVRERSQTARAGIDFAASGRATKRLLEARDLTKAFGGRTIFSGIDLRLGPGTRLGILGTNGSGKTTLLSLLDGTLAPDSGEVERAPFLKIVRFEQGRETLDLKKTLRRALAPDSDSVIHLGAVVHVAAWAKRFLFRTEQLDTPVGSLSGGEQARILVARIMLQEADLLILDEPTNDLDIATLEVLEESLIEFPGALVLVTHDRYLLDRVSTGILAIEDGEATHYTDTGQWEEARRARHQALLGSAAPIRNPKSAARAATAAAAVPRAAKRLSYLEQREWDAMEATIFAAEGVLEKSRAAAEDPGIASDAARLHARFEALAAAQAEVERLYARWAELEAKLA